jgi:acetylglutamate kinase
VSRPDVIKLGGSLLDDAVRRQSTLSAIASRWNAGEQLIVVHGGGKHIDAALAASGIAKRTHAGLRITDDATLPVVVATLAGTVNKMLVVELSALGVRAAGVAGCDAGTLVADRHPMIDGVDLGHVGRISRTSRGLMTALLTQGILPVVSSLALNADGSGLLNVNADTAAAAIAAAVGARSLTYLTDVSGVLDGSGAVVAQIDAARAESLIASGLVRGGMLPKLEAALSALRGGVLRVSIGSPDTEGGTALVAA